MIAQHTPGPWMADPADEFGDHNIVRAYESGLPMEEDRLAIAAVVSNLRPADEVAANARLIAAAPDLLQAAKWAVEIITDSYGTTAIADGDCQAVNVLSRAIAEATGQ